MANGPVPTAAEFRAACPYPEAFARISDATILIVLARKVDLVVSALGDRATPPIVSWDGTCEDIVHALTARTLMAYQGYSHDETADREIVRLAEAAETVRLGIIGKTEHPVFADSHAGYVPDAPRVASSATSDAWVTRRRCRGLCR